MIITHYKYLLAVIILARRNNMSLEEYRLVEAWRVVEDSMKTGKPINESQQEVEEVEEVEEDCPGGAPGSGATVAPGGATKGGEAFEKAGGYRHRMGATKTRKTEESVDEMAGLPAPGMETGGIIDTTSSMADIIERLKSRFPSGNIMLSVKLPSGATFSDAEIEAALDAVEGSTYDEVETDDLIGGETDEIEDTEVEDEVEDTEDEMEEGDVLPNAREPGQGPEEYLRNKPLSEDQHTHPAKGQIQKPEYKGNVGIQEADEKETDDSDDSYVKPDCFTMTVDQWESFFNSDPFKKGV